MPLHSSTWWTDDRIAATVNHAFIRAQLTQDEQSLLEQSISFGGGLTDDTYLDWILDRAKKLFLVLVDIGVPDQIFGLVDESYDDEDLPVASVAVQDLRLSQDPDRTLDKKFYKAQFRFLIRHIRDGEHIRYSEEETVPVETVGLKAGIVPLGKDGTDKVRLPPYQEIYARKRVILNQAPMNVSESDVLAEIASLRRLAHQHLVSVYASYALGTSVFVLLSPASEYTLKSFITDPPKHFENLPKGQRRGILINWPHCLANGLDWLHDKGLHHGAVRPTNILVDTSFRISLGQFDGFNITHSNAKLDEVESYQYAAPERWKRAATMKTSVGKVALPSGGRTGRKQPEVKESARGLNSNRTSWGSHNNIPSSRSSVDTVKPKSPALPFLSNLRSKSDQSSSGYEASVNSSNVSDSASIPSKRHLASSPDRPQARGNAIPSIAASVVTADTSGSGSAARHVLREPIILAPPEFRTTIVQTWHSAQYNPLPADIFALGAVIADILTFLCKRTSGAFSRYRSAKNRTAGRGGGLADASFHANIGQVLAWLALLVHDAKKKATKDNGGVFRTVEPMVEVLKGCLEREPDERIKSDQLERRLGGCVWHLANVSKLHCSKIHGNGDATSIPPEIQTSAEEFHTFTTSRGPSVRSVPETARTTLVDGDSDVANNGEVPPLAPAASSSSLSSFNFDYDFNEGRTNDDGNDNEGPFDIGHHLVPHAENSTGEPHDPIKETPLSAKEPAPAWDNWHNNDSIIDPSLAHPRLDISQVAHSEYSSGSEDDHHRSFFLSERRPASMSPLQLPDTTPPNVEWTKNDKIAASKPQTPNSQMYEQRVLPARPKQQHSSGSNDPNTSKPRTNRTTEISRSSTDSTPPSSDVWRAKPEGYVLSSANFSRPRNPAKRQTHEPGKSYLKNV